MVYPKLKQHLKPSVPKDGKGESWSSWYPFQHESLVEHHFNTSIEIMWKMLTSLEMYNIWFLEFKDHFPLMKQIGTCTTILLNILMFILESTLR